MSELYQHGVPNSSLALAFPLPGSMGGQWFKTRHCFDGIIYLVEYSIWDLQWVNI